MKTGNLLWRAKHVQRAHGGDPRLGLGSPCVDAGRNAYLPADVADLDRDGDHVEEKLERIAQAKPLTTVASATVLDELARVKPAGSKGRYFKRVSLSSTMAAWTCLSIVDRNHRRRRDRTTGGADAGPG